MYQKLIANGTTCMTPEGERVGKVISRAAGQIVLNNGITAYYGTIIDGVFHRYCTKTDECYGPCFHRLTPFCRYNKKYSGNSGYYAKIDN